MSAARPTAHVQEPTVLSTTGTFVEAQESRLSNTSSEKTANTTSTLNADKDGVFVSEALPEVADKPPPVRREGTIDPTRCPPVIPPNHTNRTLVVCFDGTGDQFDADNSNIVQLVSLLKKDDQTKQLVYYQTGIGTYTSPKVATPFMSKTRKILDEMIALNLHAHVMSGYEFLMQNYISGDKIYLFGFSRGAYTARSLAGMLHKVGLLPAGNFQQVPFAYKMYTRADDIGWEQSNEFKKAFSVDVSIEFIGVWDTVDSVGIIPKRLPFTTSNTIVKTFRHAVALDERRAKFKANLWNRPTHEEARLGLPSCSHQHPPAPPKQPTRPPSFFEEYEDFEENECLDSPETEKKRWSGEKPKIKRRKEDEDDKALNTLERMYSEKGDTMTDIEEVWFAGCHCDIGGGAVSNKTRHSLARIALRWMVRECFKCNTGIMFKSDTLRDIGLDPSTLYPYVAPRPPPLPITEQHKIQHPPSKPIPIRPHKLLTKKNKKSSQEMPKLLQAQRVPFLGSEEEEEIRDAMAPKYDQLRLKKFWWVLEWLPLQLRYQRGNNEWVTHWGLNRANPRYIPKQRTSGLKVHRSVKLRMEAEYADEERRRRGKKYVPKPVLWVEPTWID
ncbi:unnamed protein product [Cyclocybe aegerita]|uniref:T6SS Phospholipase effector Tle1-like catalytic domain-containing protein n=1 Tax=Cyclocybe aegerita TaxID=1973307 RepID=A0A8S0X135_CYCAE|nr:unnamed protein product [Cyclocybe aegerita]